MNTQSKARAERIRRIRAMMDTAQALADGEDPAAFPEFGFSPRVERLAESIRERKAATPTAAAEVLSEHNKALDQKMLETRARTLARVGWKLRELTKLLDDEPGVSVYERRLAHSVLTDVETMARKA